MAKTCSTCNRSYPDHLPACPHCEPDKARAAADDELLPVDTDVRPLEPTATPPPRRGRVATPPPTYAGGEILDVVADEEPLEVAEAEAVTEAPAEPVEVVQAAEEVLDVVAEPPGQPAKEDSGVIDLEGTTLIDEPARAGSSSSDVLEVGAADVIQDPSSGRILEVTEAEVESEPPKKPAVPPTRMGSRTPAATMLSDRQEADELPGSELGGPTAPGEYQEPPTMQRAPAPPTRVASRAPAPTMLSDKQEADEIAESELGGVTGPRDLHNLELDSAKHKKPPAGDEAIDLGAGDVLEAKPASSGKDRIIEVADADVVEAEDALEVAEAGVEVVGDSGSEVELGKKPAAKGDRSSGVDLIAEALESGMDLAGKGKEKAKDKKKRTSEVDLGHVLEGPESSAVDLGASPRPEKPKKPESDVIDVGEGVEEVSEAVDEDEVARGLLGESSAKIKGKTTKPGTATVDEEGVATATAEETGQEVVVPSKRKTRPGAPSKEEDEGPSTGRRPAAAAKGGASRFLVGAACGLLVAVGAGAALFFLGVFGGKTAEGPKQPIGQQPPPPAPSAALEAYGLVSQGKVDEALQKLDDPKEAEDFVARAEARWLKYLKEQRDKNAPLDEKHKAVQEALKDLEGKSTFHAEMITKTIEADRQARARQQAQDKAMQGLRASDKAIRDALAKALPGKKWENADLGKEVGGLANDLRDKTKLAATLQPSAMILTKVAEALKVKEDEVPTAIAQLAKTREEVLTKLKEVNAKLKAAGVEGTDGAGVQELADARKTLKEAKDALDTAMKTVLEELRQANLLPMGKDALKQAVEGIRSVRPLLRKAETISIAKTGMALSETPSQRLDTWIGLFRDRKARDEGALKAITSYADVLSQDAKASPEMKAKAWYALGLAQRNYEQFPQAIESLKKAEAELKEKGVALAGEIQLAREQLTNPAAYYLPAGRQLIAEGQLKEALAEVEAGLRAFPSNGQLAALRGLARLWQAGEGKLDPGIQKQIRADVALARKDDGSKAEAAYVEGRLEERLGSWEKAEAHYRDALTIHQQQKRDPEEAMPYRRALGRLLLREFSGEAVEQPAPKPQAPKTSRLAPEPGQREEAAAELRAALVVLLITGVQPPVDAGAGEGKEKARFGEVEKQANEMINSGNKKTQGEGYMLLGHLQYKRGDRTEGLQTYLKGLRMAFPGKLPDDREMVEELKGIIESHPGLQRPGSPERPNPQLAERHFGKGLELYWARQFAGAEKEFVQAINYFDQDARYQYFLGLARWQQNTKKKREAAAWDFEVAARLEAQRRPHTYHINASLERVQGPVRQVLSDFREKLGVGP
ncbi:MAG: hypothetical protein L0Z62_09145 [Gemmataceae bacterium]|nr:hypothetical protein [Gemmataceae bacterium]